MCNAIKPTIMLIGVFLSWLYEMKILRKFRYITSFRTQLFSKSLEIVRLSSVFWKKPIGKIFGPRPNFKGPSQKLVSLTLRWALLNAITSFKYLHDVMNWNAASSCIKATDARQIHRLQMG